MPAKIVYRHGEFIFLILLMVMPRICDGLRDWFILKCKLQSFHKTIFFKERDIWWCSLGKNLGVESDGKGENFRRPVLIIKKLNSNSFIGLPLTSKIKIGSWFYSITFNGKVNTVMLNQIKLISINRLNSRIAQLDEKDYVKTKKALKNLLGL